MFLDLLGFLPLELLWLSDLAEVAVRALGPLRALRLRVLRHRRQYRLGIIQSVAGLAVQRHLAHEQLVDSLRPEVGNVFALLASKVPLGS